MNNIDFRVMTEIQDDGVIEQIIDQVMDGAIQDTIREVANTKAAQFREALIRLGWTPPTSVIISRA